MWGILKVPRKQNRSELEKVWGKKTIHELTPKDKKADCTGCGRLFCFLSIRPQARHDKISAEARTWHQTQFYAGKRSYPPYSY